nr:hypothetical protein [Tanacetum cinerariifolium]
MTNDQANYYSGITSIMVNGNNAYELKGKFLDDLHKNSFSCTNGEDAVEHIEYFLNFFDPIDLPNMNQDKLRVVVFLISLVGDAWRWNVYDDTNHDHEYEMDHEVDERQETCSDEAHELPVCNIRRSEMIKYSFRDDEEYVVAKEDEFDDLKSIIKDAC